MKAVNSSNLGAFTQSESKVERLKRQKISYLYCPELDSLTVKDVVNNNHTDTYKKSPQSVHADLPTMLSKPLLTAAGEKRLFQKMNFLKHTASQLQKKLNAQQPKRSLIEKIEEFLMLAEESRAAIVESNTRLVASIAHRFSNSSSESDELISEGNMILLNAVDKFDYSRGFRFSTYATYAIQRHFYRFMQRKQRRTNIERAIPIDVLNDFAPIQEQGQPLDYQVAETLIARFEDCLEEREAMIIRERFGLNETQSSATLKSVADQVGLSKERVRQLQKRAIEKLQDLAIQMKIRLEPSF